MQTLWRVCPLGDPAVVNHVEVCSSYYILHNEQDIQVCVLNRGIGMTVTKRTETRSWYNSTYVGMAGMVRNNELNHNPVAMQQLCIFLYLARHMSRESVKRRLQKRC